MRLALSFLTRLPMGRLEVDDYFRRLGQQATLFPLVGLVVGGVALLAEMAAGVFFGPGVRAAAAVGGNLWVTGGLHLDGLMDTADGIGSSRTRERMLEIMKDSRVGAMGVVTGALSLLLRFAFIGEMPVALRWQALLIAPALGRMCMATVAGLWPSARKGQGMGGSFSAYVGPWQRAGALGLGLALSVAVGGWRGLLAWVLALGAGLLTARSLAGKLGGLTGDTYGAINETAEGVALAVFAAGLPVWPW